MFECMFDTLSKHPPPDTVKRALMRQEGSPTDGRMLPMINGDIDKCHHWCCTPAVLNDERGSLRSRSAAAVSSLTLRQISAVLHIASFIAHALRDTRTDQAAG